MPREGCQNSLVSRGEGFQANHLPLPTLWLHDALLLPLSPAWVQQHRETGESHQHCCDPSSGHRGNHRERCKTQFTLSIYCRLSVQEDILKTNSFSMDTLNLNCATHIIHFSKLWKFMYTGCFLTIYIRNWHVTGLFWNFWGSLSHLCDAKTGSKLVSSKSEINSSCHEKM